MLEYIILLLLSLLSLVGAKQFDKDFCRIFPYLLMSFFCGFRGNVAVDTAAYRRMFYNIDIYLVESGYKAIVKLCAYLGGTQQLVFLIMSLATSYCIYKYIKLESNDFNLSTIIYLCIGPFYFSSYNTIREALAVAIVLFFLQFYEEHKIKYIVGVLIASVFHTSALFMLIMVPLGFSMNKKNYLRNLIIITSVIILIIKLNFIPLLIQRFLPQYKNYISSHKQDMDFSYMIFLVLCFFILFMNIRLNEEIKEKFMIMISLSISMIAIPLLTGQFIMIFTRLASFLTPSIIVTVPALKNLFMQKTLYCFIVIMVCLIYYFMLLFTNTDMVPYSFNFRLWS